MPTVNYDVELTGGQLVLPEYDFNTRWSLSHANKRALVIPLYYRNEHYQRVEWCCQCKDMNDPLDEQMWSDNDVRYSDLVFGLFFYNERVRLAVRTASGRDYGKTRFYRGETRYDQDGDMVSEASSDISADYTTLDNLDLNWHEITDYIIGAQGLHNFAQQASVAVHNVLAYIPEYSIYQLEAIPYGAIVDGRTVGALELIDPISVNGVVVEEEPTYGETSGPGGGYGGSFDNSSDYIGIPSLPTGGAAASGLITMFAPSLAQLQAFGNFLWTTLFDATFDSLLTSLKKWVNDPVESVIQLACFPVTPPTGSSKVVKFCGIASDIVGTGVSMNVCSSQYTSFDFGTITVPEYWAQTLDYTPYTKVSIYLPYIGIVPLNADDVIKGTLHLVYHIDLLTGGFSAFLEIAKNINGTPLDAVLYNWSGNMATQIPITSANFSQIFGSMMTAVAAIGVGAVTGGMGAAAAGTGAEAATSSAVMGGALSGAGHGLAANIGNVINSKPHVTKSGRLDGTVGALSVMDAYLIIERPVQSLSAKFQEEQGYPSNIVQKLGDLSGMTVCEAPIMSGFSGATEEEKAAIRSMLCEGVIL